MVASLLRGRFREIPRTFGGLSFIRDRLREIPALRKAVSKMRSKYLKYSTPERFSHYLSKEGMKGLHLGCGAHLLEGWLNTDVIYVKDGAYLDITKTFPLPSSSFDYIFAEHVIEHISYQQGIELMKECYRVLKPGGVARFVTPSLERLTALYQEPISSHQEAYLKQFLSLWAPGVDSKVGRCFVLDNIFREHGHQFIYDENCLRDSLQKAGFTKINFGTVGSSTNPHLQDLEGRSKTPIKDLNQYESMVVEAIR